MIFYKYTHFVNKERLVELKLHELKTLKPTSKGYWVENLKGTSKKWVSKNAQCSYASPSKIKALNSFVKKMELFKFPAARFPGFNLPLWQIEEALLLASREIEKLKKLTL